MSREAIFKSTAGWLQRAYHRQRADWAEETGRPFPKRRKKARQAGLEVITPAEFASGGSQLNWMLGGTNTLILLTSSLTAAMAVTAIQRGETGRTLLLIGATILCAAGFMVIKYVEWSAKFSHGIYPGSAQLAGGPPGESVFFSLYFLTTGIHGLHVLIGGGLLSWIAAKVKSGAVTAGDNVLLENGVLYWHLVDLIWIFIFPLYYLIL